MDTNFCYGQIPALTRDKYAEAHELIMRAWRETEPFAFDGKYNQLRYVNCWPKPIQKPHPPIYIPGGGSIETWDFCLDHDYNYSYLSFGGYLAGKALLDGYWERVAHHGKDDSPYRAAFAQIICVADTDAEAEQLYTEHILYFYNRCLHVYPGFADAARLPHDQHDQGRRARASSPRRRSGSSRSSPGRTSSRAGTSSPAARRRCVDRMEEMITTLRVGTSSASSTSATCPTGRRATRRKLFAEKVMPHLRNMWPEWEDDDRWWFKPLDTRLDPLETVGGRARSELAT